MAVLTFFKHQVENLLIFLFYTLKVEKHLEIL